ncbi:MAG: hypothetical protein ACLFUB_00735 [Cyclobacteriaceae bacterium]
MLEQDIKQDYKDKLRRFLATPHSSMAYFEEYQKEHKQAEFDVYTKKLENLLDALENGEIKEQEALCQRIKELKLPHNQFGCGG